MKTEETTTLSVTVLSPFGIPHYSIVIKGITMNIVRGYTLLLETLHHDYSSVFTSTSFSIIICEPDLIASEIALYNNKYFDVFGISESNKVVIPLIGNPLFWRQFDEAQIIFVNHLFSNFSTEELETIYHCGESVIARRTRIILDIVNIKFPGWKVKTRKQFKTFGIKTGVHIEQRCKGCKQKL